uniref:Integrase, catalytic region, zinc finger, CCHC-type, peptidase aspartic, catalytic n=1 Tax=Tanacetum cinerariifolium TaxID=118510 RepID=A0A6L2LXS9_TANCI|nr:integrase, catalytic region, zinc finger, CCHC-type, peptidase aspartic, catalytic [Tanacetum cinerariifolium]
MNGPTITENGVTKTKRYVELSPNEKIQADCDLKATNIILQRLPPYVYALVNNMRVAKDLWDRVRLLMQGRQNSYTAGTSGQEQILQEQEEGFQQALGFQNPFYLKKAQQIRPMLYDGTVISNGTNVISIPDLEETLMLEEESRSKVLLKQSDPQMAENKVNTKLVNYALLNQLSEDYGKRFVPQSESSAEQAFWSKISSSSIDPSTSSTPFKTIVPKELPKEALFYIHDSCSSLSTPRERLIDVTPQNKDKQVRPKDPVISSKNSANLVSVTPKNKNKKVRFSEPLASSSNSYKKVESSTTLDSDKLVLLSTILKSSTSACRSQPTGNKKNDRILQPQRSSSKSKNKKSMISNRTEPTESGESIVPLSSVDCTIRFGNDHIAKIMDLDVAFRKHTCFIHDLEGVDLLKGSRDSNLYTLSLENMLSSSTICLLSKASKTKSWLWYRRLSHLNFDYITQPAKQGLVRRLSRLKFQKDHLCSASLFIWAEAVATACYIQNQSLIRKRHNKTPYQLIHDRKPDLSYLHIFGALCDPINDSKNLGKLKPKVDIGIFIGYAHAKKAFRIYNRRTRVIIETIHVDFDELTAMASK